MNKNRNGRWEGHDCRNRRGHAGPSLWLAAWMWALVTLGFLATAAHVRASDTAADRDILSLSTMCLEMAQRSAATPVDLQDAAYSRAEIVWYQHPQPNTERALIGLVTALRRELPPGPQSDSILKGLMGLLCQFGEHQFLNYCRDVLMHDGLETLDRITPPSSSPKTVSEMVPEEQAVRFASLTHWVRENITLREMLLAMLQDQPPTGLTFADPLTKGFVSLDAATARKFLGILCRTGFVGAGPTRLVRGRRPGTEAAGNMPFLPRDGFPLCAFGVTQGDAPLAVWLDFPQQCGFSNESTSLDLAMVCFVSSDVVRAIPVAPEARAILTGEGLVARRPVDVAWWLASGGGSLRVTIAKEETTLIPWEHIAKPLRDVLTRSEGPWTGEKQDLDLR